jgi:hypothetical protein
MNKFRFINGDVKRNLEYKDIEIITKFFPGQEVYFVQHDNIKKTKIESIQFQINVNEHKFVYNLENVVQQFFEENIFSSIDEIPILDLSLIEERPLKPKPPIDDLPF